MNIVLQVGQCGNQLGSQFFTNLAEVVRQKRVPVNFSEEAKERFFSNGIEKKDQIFPRAVLVDTEPKVIQECVSSAQNNSIPFREDCIYSGAQGAANNWAMGYNEHGSKAKEPVLDLVRRESERCDYLEGFNVFMSVAGGTGSGLGTFITDTLKDEYPKVPIMNQIVYPFKRGEVTVQAHNSMLTLSHLQNSSDAMVVFENDLLYNICSQRLGMKDVTLSNMNDVACSQLLSLLLPSRSSTGSSRVFGDILSHLAAHPQFKLMNLRSVPQEPLECRAYSSYAWQSLLRILRRMILYSSVVEEWAPKFQESATNSEDTCISISNLLILRGSGADSVSSDAMHNPSLPYANWVPFESRINTWHSMVQLFEQQKMGTVAHNGQSVIPCIDSLVAKSWTMFSYKAYLHHYIESGLEMDTFRESFEEVEQIIASYKELSSI